MFLGEGCQVLGAQGGPVWKGPFSALRKHNKRQSLALLMRGPVPNPAHNCLWFVPTAGEFLPRLAAKAAFLPAAQPWASPGQLQPQQSAWQSPGRNQTSLKLPPCLCLCRCMGAGQTGHKCRQEHG